MHTHSFSARRDAHRLYDDNDNDVADIYKFFLPVIIIIVMNYIKGFFGHVKKILLLDPPVTLIWRQISINGPPLLLISLFVLRVLWLGVLYSSFFLARQRTEEKTKSCRPYKKGHRWILDLIFVLYTKIIMETTRENEREREKKWWAHKLLYFLLWIYW